MEESDIKDRLLKENQEFRKTYDQHQKLEKKLAQFHVKCHLTDEDKWKEKQLKKDKLQLKDKMYHIMTEYGKSLD
jgi:uncharacterized protein YdcH (DUF465 family)